jgi:hypothetical protein
MKKESHGTGIVNNAYIRAAKIGDVQLQNSTYTDATPANLSSTCLANLSFHKCDAMLVKQGRCVLHHPSNPANRRECLAG